MVLSRRNNREDYDRILPLVEAFRCFVFPIGGNPAKLIQEAKYDSSENEVHIGSHCPEKLKIPLLIAGDWNLRYDLHDD